MKNEKLTKDEETAMSPDELANEIKSLSLGEFKRVLDEVFNDESLSQVEKMLVVKDLHQTAGRQMNYDTVGKLLGISREGAFQVEKRAMKKIKKLLLKSGFGKDDIE